MFQNWPLLLIKVLRIKVLLLKVLLMKENGVKFSVDDKGFWNFDMRILDFYFINNLGFWLALQFFQNFPLLEG